jgi:hypothetical protein
MSRQRLEGLAHLGGMVRDRDLAALAGAVRARAAIEAELAAIEAARAARARDLAALDAPDPALRAGADGPWLAGLDRRRRALLIQLAAARAACEAAKGTALIALGRADVLDRLVQRARAAGLSRPGG